MKASARQGYLDGNALAEVFAWLRPNDLIWNYWVNNYLLGRKPPAFDILYWNADTTRMPARLHHDFLRLAIANALVTPDAAMMLGTPVDLGKVDADNYVVAGVADHICPWQSCYQSTQLLGGDEPVRAVDQRAHRRPRQPAREPEGELPSRRRPGPDAETGPRRPSARADRGGPTTPPGSAARSGRSKRAPRRLGEAGSSRVSQRPGRMSSRNETRSVAVDGVRRGSTSGGRRAVGHSARGRQRHRRVS